MTVAYIALFGWPLLAIVLFKRFSTPLAVLSTILYGYLFLPTLVEVDLPALPSLNKETIPAFTAFVLIATAYRASLKAPGTTTFFPRVVVARFCLVMLVVGAFMTVNTNSDPLFYGPTRLPGLRTYDALSIVLSLLTTLTPFLLAHKYLAHPKMQRLFLKTMVIAGLIYSLLALFEIRMSPQLNVWIYGFFPHNFLQHMRGGGFRPLVFLEHGLVLSIFFSATILAAVGLARLEGSASRRKYLGAAVWLLITLILSKSLGALVITALLLPVAFFLSSRMHLLLAAILAVMIMAYPVLRSAGYVPVDRIMEYTQNYDAQRADSLRIRLKNEDAFLEKAAKRPLFGWGGYGRSRVFNERGDDISTADGTWVITLGIGGWNRYLALFGLLCLPMVFLFMFRRRLNIGLETSVLALMLTANLVDLIPNASMTPVTWMMAGALWGRISLGRVSEGMEDQIVTPPRRVQQYARPGPKHGRPGAATVSYPKTARARKSLVLAQSKG